MGQGGRQEPPWGIRRQLHGLIRGFPQLGVERREPPVTLAVMRCLGGPRWGLFVRSGPGRACTGHAGAPGAARSPLAGHSGHPSLAQWPWTPVGGTAPPPDADRPARAGLRAREQAPDARDLAQGRDARPPAGRRPLPAGPPHRPLLPAAGTHCPLHKCIHVIEEFRLFSLVFR